MKKQTLMIIAAAISAPTAYSAPADSVIQDLNTFKQHCESQQRAANRQCRSEFREGVKSISAGKAPMDLDIEHTLLDLCEREAKLEYNQCIYVSYFENTNVLDIVQGGSLQQLTEGSIEYQINESMITPAETEEELSPLLTGSDYRAMTHLCEQMPGVSTVGGYMFWGATGYSVSGMCMDTVMSMCMDDPQMGSNTGGNHAPYSSEREQNCAEAVWSGVPVI